MFKWLFGKSDKLETKKLCSLCNRFEPIKSDMGNEFCFKCLTIRYKDVIDGYDYGIERGKLVKYNRNLNSADCRIPAFGKQCHLDKDNHCNHCIKYINKCFHTVEFKDNCLYGQMCEFINPTTIKCADHCRSNIE
jgi:hypothetical protein